MTNRWKIRGAMRIQIARNGILQAEVIVEESQVNNIFPAYCQAKYRKGESGGGASIGRADLPRLWNVKVGSVIFPED